MRSARILLALRFGVRLGGQTVTFSEHVAPILFHNCAICHRPGEAGPFTLLSYQHAQSRGRQIAEVTASGYMPPWKPEAGYAEYKNKRGLTREQIEVIQKWYAGPVCWLMFFPNGRGGASLFAATSRGARHHSRLTLSETALNRQERQIIAQPDFHRWKW
jgi:hypothetical protein